MTLVDRAFCGREVPTVVRAEFNRSGFTESHMRGVRFVGWRTTATLVTHVARLVDAGEPFVYAYYDGVDKVAHEYGITDGFFPAETSPPTASSATSSTPCRPTPPWSSPPTTARCSSSGG